MSGAPLLNDPAVVDPSLNVTELVTFLPRLQRGISRDIASVVAQSVFYGMYILVFAAACSVVLKKRRSRLATQIIGVSTVLMFLTSTYLYASAIWVLFYRVQLCLGERDPISIVVRTTMSNSDTARVRYAEDMLFIISFLIGDVVIGWRILVLWQWHRIATLTLGLLYVGTFASGWGMIGCLIHSNFPEAARVPRLCTEMSNVSWLLSLVFNIVATGLLASIALQIHRANRAVDVRRRSNVDRVLTFLVATGVLYIMLGAPRLSSFRNATLQPLTSDFTMATQTIEQILYQLVNLYPTAVTVVLSYFTHLDETQLSGDDTGLAHGGVRTGTSLFNASRRTPASGTAVVMMGSGKQGADRSIDNVSLGPLGDKRSFHSPDDDGDHAGPSMFDNGYGQSRRSSYGRPYAS